MLLMIGSMYAFREASTDRAQARPWVVRIVPFPRGGFAELARRLQGRGPALVLPLNWIEQRLSESGLTIEHLVQLETQQQASDQVSISNSIGSLRVLGAMDWREFVETTSVVERALILPPASRIGPQTTEERQAVIRSSAIYGHYEQVIDRESAYEKLKGSAVATQPNGGAPAGEAAPAAPGGGWLGGLSDLFGGGSGSGRGRGGDSVIETAAKSAARAIGSQVGREIIRGVLGSILGGGSRRR